MSADTTLTCRDCGQVFTFTSGEQEFYASRGFSEPGRCPDCRAARKSQRDGGSSYGSYGSSYGGGGGGGDSAAGRGPRGVCFTDSPRPVEGGSRPIPPGVGELRYR